MKKLLIALIVIVVLAAAGTYWHFSGKEYVFRFTEAQLQEKLGAKMPFTKSYLILQVTLDNARVSLADGSGRIGAGMDIVLNLRVGDEAKPLGGSIDVTGGLAYNPGDGAFFLTDPVIERLQVQGIPEKHLLTAQTAVSKAVAEYYRKNPVYALSSTDAKQVAAWMVLKNVVVRDHTLIVTLGI